MDTIQNKVLNASLTIGRSFFISLSLVFGLALQAAEVKDEFKEKLMGGGKKQKEAVLNLKTESRQDLLPLVSEILKETDYSEDLQGIILDTYISYGEDLPKFHSNYVEDLEWVLTTSKNEPNLVKVIKFANTLKEKRLIYPIIDLITYRDAEVRGQAFLALETFKDDRAIPYILELGNSEKPIYRYYYLEALNYMRDDRLSLHIPRLLNDPSPAIRSESIVAIEKLGLADKMNQVLAMATNDSNYEVRKFAVVSLKNQYSKFHTTVFQKTIFDPHKEVRDVTVDAINKIKDASYAKFVSTAMEKENLSFLRFKMIDTLLLLNNHGGGTGLSVALRNDSDSEVRSKAAYAVGQLKAKNVVPDLITSLELEKVVAVKIESTRALSVLKEKSAVPVILSRLQDEAEATNLRSEFLTALNNIDDPQVMPVIFDLIEVERKDPIRIEMKSLLRTMLYRYHKGYRIGTDKVSVL